MLHPMKPIAGLILALSILVQATSPSLSLSQAAPPADPLAQAVRIAYVRSSVVLLHIQDPLTGKMIGRGSGVMVHSDGWILTNKHVALDSKGTSLNTLVKTVDVEGNVDATCTYTIVANSYLPAKTQDDLVLLIPPKNTACAKPFSFVRFEKQLPPIGTRIQLVGFPATGVGGDSITITSGQIAGQVIENGELRYLKTDAKVVPGVSGGLVVDEQGKIHGLITAGTIGQSADVLQILTSDSIGLIIPGQNILAAFPELASPRSEGKPRKKTGQLSKQKMKAKNTAVGRKTRTQLRNTNRTISSSTKKQPIDRPQKKTKDGAPSSDTKGLLCTVNAWQCTQSSCSKEKTLVQTCKLVDTQCTNPERSKPPETLACIPGEKQLQRIKQGYVGGLLVLKAMDEVAPRLPRELTDGLRNLRNAFAQELKKYGELHDSIVKGVEINDIAIRESEEKLLSMINKFESKYKTYFSPLGQ